MKKIKKHRQGTLNEKIFRTSIYLSIFLSVALMASCRGLFFNPQNCYEKNILLEPYDAIIVPGVPFDSAWSYTMKGRVLWSVYLYRNGYVKNIIYSGSAVYSPFTEGKIMAMYAEKLGVKPANIFVESRAEHSTENVFYSGLIAKKKGFKKVALATDRFQSRTLSDYLPKVRRKLDLDIRSLPMQDELTATMPHDDPAIEYNLARVDSFVSLVNRESKLKRFWGTMGKNIKYRQEKEAYEKENSKTN